MIKGHGDDAYQFEDIRINFSSNIYSHADMSALKEHLCRHIHVIDSYPEPEPFSLERLIAEQHGIPADCVLVTNGATEAIYLVAQMVAPQIGSFILDGPSFSEYADACRLYGLSPRSENLSRSEDYSRYEVRGTLGENSIEGPDSNLVPRTAHLAPRDNSNLVPSHPRTPAPSIHSPRADTILWLCNPNNPTGRVYTQTEIDGFLTEYPLVVVDQSYEHHTLERIMTPAEGILHDNLVQIHSLTKTYAIPGLRIGFVTAQPHLIDRLRRFVRPWSVNALAIEAARWLLTHDMKAIGDLPAYLHEAQRLRQNLNAIPGIEVLPTKTNFMLARMETLIVRGYEGTEVRGYENSFVERLRVGELCSGMGEDGNLAPRSPLPAPQENKSNLAPPHHRTLAPSKKNSITASALKTYLAHHHGILIRDASNFNDLDERYFRIAAQLPEENDLLVEAIRSYLNEA